MWKLNQSKENMLDSVLKLINVQKRLFMILKLFYTGLKQRTCFIFLNFIHNYKNFKFFHVLPLPLVLED